MGKRKEEVLPPKSEGAMYAENKLQRYAELRQYLNEFKGFKMTGLDNLIRIEDYNTFKRIDLLYEYEYIVKDSLLEYERELEREIAEIEEIFDSLVFVEPSEDEIADSLRLENGESTDLGKQIKALFEEE